MASNTETPAQTTPLPVVRRLMVRPPIDYPCGAVATNRGQAIEVSGAPPYRVLDVRVLPVKGGRAWIVSYLEFSDPPKVR